MVANEMDADETGVARLRRSMAGHYLVIAPPPRVRIAISRGRGLSIHCVLSISCSSSVEQLQSPPAGNVKRPVNRALPL